MKQDALGNEILFDTQIYGYARNKNGINTVYTGRAVKETEHGVTLELLCRRIGVYDNLIDENIITTKINVKSIMLFPIESKDCTGCYYDVGQDKSVLWEKETSYCFCCVRNNSDNYTPKRIE